MLLRLRWFFLPYWIAPSIWTFFNTAPILMVFGFYLSVFFHISHNFEGVQQLQDTSPKKSWLYNQVILSINIRTPGYKSLIIFPPPNR